MNLADQSITQIGRALRAGIVSSEELTRSTLARIDRTNGRLAAFVNVTGDRALQESRRADANFAAGIDRGPLQGIPYAVKDIFDAAGVPTTCQSKLRLQSRAVSDCAAVETLTSAGAVLIGKLATHEFAFYGPDVDLPFPPARNPWDSSRLTGGSSSGSAVAVASGLVRFALGSDTGGSARTPASWCGVSGLKPTFGLLCRRGVFPLSWSLDHVGVLARSVADCAIAADVLAGTANTSKSSYNDGLELGVRGLRIGIPREFLSRVSADVMAGFEQTIRLLRQDGAVIVDVVLPELADYGATARAIMFAEAFHLHRKALRDHPTEFGPVSGKRLFLGAAYSASDYIAALTARQILATAMHDALRDSEVLLCTTTTRTAPNIGDAAASPFSPSAPSLTNPFNVSGNPAISVPIGLDESGLPIGVQVVGRLFDEHTLLRVARTVEMLSGWEQVSMPCLEAEHRQSMIGTV